MILFLKLTLTPCLVAGVSLVARAFGPTIGGLVMGVPWLAAAILFVLSLEQDAAWTQKASVGSLGASIAIAAYSLAYGLVARVASWPFAILAATCGFVMAGWATVDLALSLEARALAGCIAFGLTYLLLPQPSNPASAGAMPWWDIPVRMTAAVAMTLFVASLTEQVPSEVIGLVASFPVLMTTILAFTQARWGRDAALGMLRGVVLSLQSFVAFFWVLAEMIPIVGVYKAYLVAMIAGFAISGALLLLNRLDLQARLGDGCRHCRVARIGAAICGLVLLIGWLAEARI